MSELNNIGKLPRGSQWRDRLIMATIIFRGLHTCPKAEKMSASGKSLHVFRFVLDCHHETVERELCHAASLFLWLVEYAMLSAEEEVCGDGYL